MRVALVALSTIAASNTAWRGACSGGASETGGRRQTAHGVVRGGAVGGANARELVGIGGDVGDELLSCEGKQAGEVRGSLIGACTGRGQASESEVVRSDGIGDLGAR